MLLRRHNEDEVEVVVVQGSLSDDDAATLAGALSAALAASSRGVVVDLTGTDDVSPRAVDVLATVATAAARRPRVPLTACGVPPGLRRRLAPVLAIHEARHEALQHLGDLPPPTRRDVTVEHGPHGPAQARSAVAEWAGQVGLGRLCDDLLLIVSELVTNAVRYGRPPVRVEVWADERSVTVAVIDGSSSRPQRRPASTDAESGRGLLLIDVLSVEHGVRPQDPGKAVWARLARS